MLNGLALFAGIGGIELALRRWVRTVCYVERDEYAAAVLMSRMRSGDLDEAPIWDDVTTFDTRGLAGRVDIISGGSPCQDISLAGKGAGLAGERSGLFREIVRIAGEIRPRFIFLENVPAITVRGGIDVGGAFAALGYDCRWGVLSAFDVGAPHQRERWWCLAHSNAAGRGQQPDGRTSRQAGHADELHADVAYARSDGSQGSEPTGSAPGMRRRPADTVAPNPHTPPLLGSAIERDEQDGNPAGVEALADAAQFPERESADQSHAVTGSRETWPEPCGRGWWSVEPDVGRVASRISQRVDRLRCLGNGVVPQCAEEAFGRLMGIEDMEALRG